MPRTPDGKPDLQGNWSNETQTPFERLGNQGATLTDKEAAAIEDRARLVEEYRDKASDPNRPPPKRGRRDILAAPGQQSFIEIISEAAGGRVGGYNGFWLDPGNSHSNRRRGAQLDHRRSDRLAAFQRLTAEGKQRMAERAALAKKFGEFDHPEVRPLSDRCLMSFGSNAGSADAAQLLLQQQLPDRADAGSHHDHDGDGARRPHHPDGREPAHPAGTFNSGWATRSAVGKATRWSWRRPTFTRCSWRS